MANKMAFQMRDRMFPGTDPLSVIALLQNIESVYDAGGIHEVAAMWLLKKYPTGPTEAALKCRIALPNAVNLSDEGTL